MVEKRWGLASAAIVALAVASFFVFRSVYTKKEPASEGSDQAAVAAKDRQVQPAEEKADQQGETATITGQTTLAELQRQSGVRATEIAKRLNLPPSVPRDEPLGRLQQRYPFTMDQVRDILAALPEGAAVPDPSEAADLDSGPDRRIASHEAEPKLTRGRAEEDQSGILITGQTTLREIELRCGVSARLIAGRLGLPAHVSLDTRLGRLRQKYPFTIQQVRDITSDLMKQARR